MNSRCLMLGGSMLLGSLFLAVDLAAADESGVYSAYDRNADGYLDAREFERFLKKRRVREPYRRLWVFGQVDSNGDGLISNQELVDTLQREMRMRRNTGK